MANSRLRLVVTFCAIGFGFVLTGCGSGEQAATAPEATLEAETGLVLSAEDIENLGITTAPVVAAEYAQQVRGYGVVINLDSIAQSDAEIATARAAATQSAAALARERALMRANATSSLAIEAAQKQAATDQAQLALAERKEIASFGKNPPWRRRGASVAQMIAEGSVVVHATFPLNALSGGLPKQLRIARLDAALGSGWTADDLWEGPSDSTVPGRSLFALVKGSDLSNGERVLAYASQGELEQGVLIPREAALIANGAAWYYAETMPGQFERKPLDMEKVLPGGYFTAEGVKPGGKIVTKGTGLLFARESGGAGGEEE